MEVVLSGMSNIDQMKDNISAMKDFEPLSAKETEAVMKVAEVFNSMGAIPCTACRYCIEENHCPKDIVIPEAFMCYNRVKLFNDWNQKMYYMNTVVKDHGKAGDCIECGMCEAVCPQHLGIRDLLVKVADRFE
jgi:predicted aldo/keto reductase-like oxidoreductase